MPCTSMKAGISQVAVAATENKAPKMARTHDDLGQQAGAQRQAAQHEEECAPAVLHGIGQAQGEIQRDRQRIGRQDDAQHQALAARREPLHDDLHGADPDCRIEEADHQAQQDQLQKILRLGLGQHQQAAAAQADQIEAGRTHVPAARRPEQHAQREGHPEGALHQPCLGLAQGQVDGHDLDHRRKAIEIGRQAHLAGNGHQQHQHRHAVARRGAHGRIARRSLSHHVIPHFL